MATGKNKLTRAVVVLWDNSATVAKDLSADLIPGSLSGPGFTAGEIDMTGESDTAENFLADRKTNTVTAKFHANDTATTGASTVLNDTVGVVGTLTVQIGAAGVAPTTGDLEWEGEYVLLSANLSNEGGRLIHSCTWRPSGATPPAWGTVS